MDKIPVIIPSPREWNKFSGDLILSKTCQIVVDCSCAEQLAGTAQVLQEAIRAETGYPMPIIHIPEPANGDIFLTLNCSDKELGEQGYILEIDDYIKLRANTVIGIFYGGQTFLQMLHKIPTHVRVPRGKVRDYPIFPQRGIMLDAGRKYWGMDYLYKIMRQMTRLKLNTLHLHLSDWNAFRLQSDLHPGLSASQAYSKSDIASLHAYARQCHITIVPEIDLPAHATVISRYDPSLAFSCEVMSKVCWPGGESGGFTLDYTSPKVRCWIKELLDEFIPLFDGPYFHIGSDEIAEPDRPEQCPGLVDYAKARGYPYITDVLVEWINEMNAFVKSYGKQMQIWNWWERKPHSLTPDRDILINAWVGAGDPSLFLEQGYHVINSPEDTHYITPGINLLPDNEYLYERWSPNTHPNMLGYKLCVWADGYEDEPDEYFETYLHQPLAILAERTWNLYVPSRPLETFLALANKVILS